VRGSGDTSAADASDAANSQAADDAPTEAADAGDADASFAPTPDDAPATDAATSDTPSPTLSLTTSPLAIHPAFSPSIHDYYVRCAAGANALTITMSGSSNASIALSLEEDQLAVVENLGDEGGDSYFIRCLPHDFPVLTATVHPAAGTPTPGYYLIGNASAASGQGTFAMVIDVNATPVWYHRSSAGVIDVDLLSSGTISYAPYVGYGTNGVFEAYGLDPWHRDVIRTVDLFLDVHELRAVSDGGHVLLAAPFTNGVDLSGLAGHGPNSSIINCAIQELDAAGNVVWQWLATDHIDPVKESTAPVGTSPVDVFHCNSVDIDEQGNLLLSSRHTDAVYYIEKASGKILWKLGGSSYNKDGARLIRVEGDPQVSFYRQHDARFRPNGGISLFDDHGAGTGPARGVEYALDIEGGVATVRWQYTGAASSLYMGSFRRYDDGTSVIGWGGPASGKNLVFTEVDGQGNDLLDLEFGPGSVSYRAVKVPLGALDAAVLRATAGLP